MFLTYRQKPHTRTRAQIKDPEEVTNKMYGCNIAIEVTLSGSLICARVSDTNIDPKSSTKLHKTN